MTAAFNPYDAFTGGPPPAGQIGDREQRRAATLSALNHPAGRQWLQARLAEETARPSYIPGTPHDQAAYAEGRKAMLREIAAELFQAPQT